MRFRPLLSVLVFLPALAGCDPFGGGARQQRKAARTAEAPVTIVRAEEVVSTDPEDMTADTLHKVVWRFEAQGRAYTDSIPATLYIPSESYKACYDPADPTNSSIELADIACSRSP